MRRPFHRTRTAPSRAHRIVDLRDVPAIVEALGVGMSIASMAFIRVIIT